jgi:hypothetical protein
MSTSKRNGRPAAIKKTTTQKTNGKNSSPAKTVAKPTAKVVPIRKPKELAKKPETKALPLGKAFAITIDVDELRPMLAVAPKADARFYLNGVQIAKRGNDLRLTATDGHRLLIQSLPFEGELPWGKDGIILPTEQLERILKYTGTKWERPLTISYGENHEAVKISTEGAVFKVHPIDGSFPKIKQITDDVGKILLSEREPLETTSILPKYLKAAGQIATLLGAEGVFCYPDAKSEAIFTFAGAPNVILIQMGMRSDKPPIGAAIARMIGKPALAGTLTALKAHRTRWSKAAKGEKDDKAREAAEAKVAMFGARINEIMAGLNPKLEHQPNGAQS